MRLQAFGRRAARAARAAQTYSDMCRPICPPVLLLLLLLLLLWFPFCSVLERSNVVMRDVESWESDFTAVVSARREAEAKVYPQQLLDHWQASEKVLGGAGAGAGAAEGAQGGAGKGGGGAGAGGSKAGGGGGGGEASAAASDDAAGAPSSSLDMFFESTGAVGEASTTRRAIQAAPRITPADQINDQRSLDRAYSQRLVFVVRDKATGEWTIPGGEVHEGEPLRQAAERWVRSFFGPSSRVSLWYVGGAPVGHWLRAYPPDVQQATKCYGEKVFFYRAEILAGRFRMPAPGEAGRAGLPFDDFKWLTRDETEAVFSRPFYKYAHQMIGGGPGEEAARHAAWQERVKARGWTLAKATAVRARREADQRAAGLRMPFVVTRADAGVAAMKTGKEKAAAAASAVDQYHDRVRESRAVGAQLRAALAQKPMVAVLAQQLAVGGRAATGKVAGAAKTA
jgi:hypothetical protein